MKRSLRFLALAVVPLGFLAACGSSQQFFRLRADAPAPLAAAGRS